MVQKHLGERECNRGGAYFTKEVTHKYSHGYTLSFFELATHCTTT